jgi:Kef-type K+ transport system membrane component KefB
MDTFLWLVFSVALNLQDPSTNFNNQSRGIFKVVIFNITFTVFTILVIPMILRIFGKKISSMATDSALVGYSLLSCMVLVMIALWLKVNIVFASLLAGIVVGKTQGIRMKVVRDNITTFSANFFVPIYFALVGFKLDLISNLNFRLLLTVLILTSITKVVSVSVFIRHRAGGWATAIDYGISMNARGGPGIVLASLAQGAGIIGDALFIVLVLTSLLTSIGTGVWLRYRSGQI